MARFGPLAAALLCLVLGSACGGRGAKSAAKVPTPPRAAPTAASLALVAEAQKHLASGIGHARAGDRTAAREAFDRAVDTYLTAPGGAYANPTIAESYRRTLETIHVHEIEALSAGEDVAEVSAEPASIDELGQLRIEADAATAEARRAAEETLREKATDLPLTVNDEVLACIGLYQTNLREWFGSALRRGAPHLPRIREVFAAAGIPQDLVYVALVESAFKSSALSRAKARGMWQFMPDTGREYGLAQDWWIDERSDPEKATRAAAAYLKSLYGMFGDWNLALAAYNAGPGRVQRQLNLTGASDYWELVRAQALPRETRNYVPMIQAAILVAKAADKYGFEVPEEKPRVTDRVAVKEATALKVVAECAGASIEDVRELNPELRRLATPANRSFPVKVPEGTGKRVATCLASMPAEKRVAFRTHVVTKGQTLSSIARRHGVKASDVAEANGLGGRKVLARGTELIIPVERGRVTPARHDVKSRRTASATPRQTKRGSSRSGSARVMHKVKPGDTLVAIAARYGTTVKQITGWNRLKSTRLAIGNVLTIY